MTKQRERTRRALRGCAEAGIPETVDLWPVLRERTATEQRRGSLRTRFLPRTRVGLAFAIFAALLVMTGAGYAASGLVFAAFQEQLPGADARDVGTELGQEQVKDGARVTLEWAYADQEFLVVGYSVKDLEDDRRNAGRRVQLEPVFVGKDDAAAGRGPRDRATLTDESGRELGMLDGVFQIAGPGDGLDVLRMPKANSGVFEVPEGLEPGRKHRFHLEIPLVEAPTFSSNEEGGVRFEPKPPIGPFVFDFEVPVRPAPTVELDQKIEANGLEVTLDRVVDSPARPQAVICFRPPLPDHEWHPMVEVRPADREPLATLPLGDDCWSAPLYGRPGERSSLTVTAIDGVPLEMSPDGVPLKGGASSPEQMQPTTIRGPWKFEFEVPVR